jgi:hypothetical protein
VSPDRQIRTVIHVEGSEEKDVRKTHPRHVDARPASPELASRRASDESRCERENAEDEEVNVVRPAHDGEDCHRPEDDQETPIIDRSGGRMSAGTLRTEHGDHARDAQIRPAATCTPTVERKNGEDDGIGIPKTVMPWSVKD